jgi:hypothetical protein
MSDSQRNHIVSFFSAVGSLNAQEMAGSVCEGPGSQLHRSRRGKIAMHARDFDPRGASLAGLVPSLMRILLPHASARP